jgi:hypothetical protein
MHLRQVLNSSYTRLGYGGKEIGVPGATRVCVDALTDLKDDDNVMMQVIVHPGSIVEIVDSVQTARCTVLIGIHVLGRDEARNKNIENNFKNIVLSKLSKEESKQVGIYPLDTQLWGDMSLMEILREKSFSGTCIDYGRITSDGSISNSMFVRGMTEMCNNVDNSTGNGE